MKTATPLVDRVSISQLRTLAITGTLPGESPGTIVYVYLNMRRAGTTVIQNDAARTWILPIEKLSFGGGAAKLRNGDRLYVQARAVGKDMSDPTILYTIGGIDQPSAPYVLDEVTGTPRALYERDTLIQGDVPLMLDFSTNPPQQVLYTSNVVARIEAGVSVSVYVEETFLAQVQSDQYGHWMLDLAQHFDHPLLPLSKGQILSVKATRHREPLPGQTPEQLAYPSAESPKAVVLSGYFQQRLFDFYPMNWKADDRDIGNGDLANFTKVLALTLDDVKNYIDTFPSIFDVERCEPKYFDALAALLGYPLNRLDSIESQRLQIKNAIQFWRKKGTTDIFRILFYLLDYDIEMIELWTQDYRTMYPVDAFGYPKSQYPLGPPNTAPELVENGGRWFKTPYFGIIINPITTYESTTGKNYPYEIDREACLWETGASSVSLSLDDLKYLLERIDYFRPAHTVLDYISFRIPIQECGPIPYQDPNFPEWFVRWQPEAPGWYLPYCDPDDPIYFRDGLRSTRPDGKGTIALGINRDPTGPHATTRPEINMKRDPQRGYCHPPEDLVFDLQPSVEDDYWFYMKRDGMGPGMYPMQEPLDPNTIDGNDWPSRNPLTDPPKRDGKYRYTSRLKFTLEAYQGA